MRKTFVQNINDQETLLEKQDEILNSSVNIHSCQMLH